MARAKKNTVWSYQTGERGTNRVNLFERGKRGFYLEFRERTTNGGPCRRVRVSLGHIGREEAKATAEQLALEFRRHEPAKKLPLTLRRLFDIYEREVTGSKARTTQGHDRRCIEMFCRFLGNEMRADALSLRDLHRFIADRRAGKIAPANAEPNRKVGNRIIQSDLAFLQAVLNYATRAGDGSGAVLLDRNPWKGLPIPRNESPARPALTEAQYRAVRSAAGKLGPWAELLVVLAHETGHRAGSIRQLRWSDIDFANRRIHWRGEVDKIGNDHYTPATEEALSALTVARRTQNAIGESYLFPARRGNRSQPMSGNGVFNVWKRIAKGAGLPQGQRFGWHSLRRQFASELRNTNLRDLCDLGGWKSINTVLTCYVRPDEEAQRSALSRRGLTQTVAKS